jgi:hypothetical protein
MNLNLSYMQQQMLQEASGSSAGQVYVGPSGRARETAEALVDVGYGVIAYDYFIVNNKGAATAWLWPKAAA